MAFDLYQHVTDQIIGMLEQGVAPWRSPILGAQAAGWPKNLVSDKQYRGVNVFLLAFTAWAEGHPSAYWLTFNQIKQRGGTVRKGEKSTMVVFWKMYETTDRETGEPTEVPVLRYYRVFNAGQCDGIEVPDAEPLEPIEFRPDERADAIVAGYLNGPTVEHRGTKAFYRPASDMVRMPERERFSSSAEYYSTLLHELAHSTGHSKRLNRGLDSELQPFGSPDYGREELVAEMASAFLCAEAGLESVVMENQASYLAGWIQKLRGDSKLIVQAAGAAQRAADWILGTRG